MELFIDNKQVDLGRGQQVLINLTADSLESVDSIQSSYSREIATPLTLRNRAIIGELQALDSSRREYTGVTCDLRDNSGATVIASGELIFNRVEGDSAYGNIYAGVVSFLNELDGVTLQDIGINQIGTPVERTDANIVANIANDYTDGFTYATFNNGNYTGGAYDKEQLFPIAFVYEVLNALASKTGFTLDVAIGLMADAFFQKWVLPFNGERYNEDGQFFGDVQGFAVTAGTVPAGTYIPISTNVGGGGSVLLENNNYDGTFFSIPNGNKAYFFEGRVDFEITTASGAYEYNLRIRNETQGIDLATFASGAITGGGATVNVSHTLQTGLLDSFNSGDVISFGIDAVTGLNFACQDPSYFRNDDGRWNDAPSEATNLYQDPPSGFVLDPLTVLPNLNAVDFVKAVLSMGCSRLDVDSVKKEIKIRRFKDYSRDFAAPFDISDKVDRSKTIKKESYFGNYGRTNLFTYDNDDDVPSDLGSGLISIDNKNLTAEPVDLIELPFSASVNTLNGLSIPIAEGGSNDVVNELIARIAYINSVSDTVTVGSDTANPYNELLFQELYWQYQKDVSGTPTESGLLIEYWDEFGLVIKSMDKTTLSILMNAIDFQQLNFFNPVYLNWSDGAYSFNGFYLLQLVDDYDGRGIAELELIRINLT